MLLLKRLDGEAQDELTLIHKLSGDSRDDLAFDLWFLWLYSSWLFRDRSGLTKWINLLRWINKPDPPSLRPMLATSLVHPVSQSRPGHTKTKELLDTFRDSVQYLPTFYMPIKQIKLVLLQICSPEHQSRMSRVQIPPFSSFFYYFSLSVKTPLIKSCKMMNLSLRCKLLKNEHLALLPGIKQHKTSSLSKDWE